MASNDTTKINVVWAAKETARQSGEIEMASSVVTQLRSSPQPGYDAPMVRYTAPKGGKTLQPSLPAHPETHNSGPPVFLG